MKIQELLEMNENLIRFDTYEEFKKFFDSKAKDDRMYHFEDISGKDGNEYDILVRVYNIDEHEDNRVSVDWDIIAYGTGDYDTDTNFWVKEGRPDIDPKYDRYIENKIIEDNTF